MLVDHLSALQAVDYSIPQLFSPFLASKNRLLSSRVAPQNFWNCNMLCLYEATNTSSIELPAVAKLYPGSPSAKIFFACRRLFVGM